MRRVSTSLAWLCMLVTFALVAAAAPAHAQQTTGTIAGRLVDDQGGSGPRCDRYGTQRADGIRANGGD